MNRLLSCLILLFPLSAFAQSEPLEQRVIEAVSRYGGWSEQDVIRYYKACDSGWAKPMGICGTYQWKSEDARLNDLYAIVSQNLKGTRAAKRLVVAQRAWLVFRDANCDYETGDWIGADRVAVTSSCLATVTRERVKQLEGYANCREASCPGDW